MNFTISLVTLESESVTVMTAKNELHQIKVGWPVFERRLGTLKGRKLYGYQYGPLGTGMYKFAATILPSDHMQEFETMESPSGSFARIRLEGPTRHDQIGLAFEALFEGYGDAFDSTRPTVEYYKDNNTVDVLLPITQRKTNG